MYGQSGVDSRVVWSAIIAADSYAESDWNPGDIYTESFRNDAGELVKSEGLLQLSVEDVQSYPSIKGCGLTALTILDPIVNLHCALGIMAVLVQNKPSLSFQQAVGGSAANPVYWSTLETGAHSCPMRSKLHQLLPACNTPIGDCDKDCQKDPDNC